MDTFFNTVAMFHPYFNKQYCPCLTYSKCLFNRKLFPNFFFCSLHKYCFSDQKRVTASVLRHNRIVTVTEIPAVLPPDLH